MSSFFSFVLISLSASVQISSASVIDMQNKTCVDYNCHANLQSKAFVHEPADKGICGACHIQAKPELHQFQLSAKKEELCWKCHIISKKNHLHKPVADGRCTDCHDPHQSDFQFVLKADPAKDLCLLCHKDESFMKKQYLHSPVASGACILCHEPHSSWKPKLLVTEGKQLCITCHEEKIRMDKQSRHVHPAIDEDCAGCHDPHSSDSPQRVREPIKETCLTCHTEIKQLIAKSKIVHGPLNEPNQCRNCHYGHASMLPKLLKKSPLDTCLSCHDREIMLDDGRKIDNIADLLKKNPNHHGPIRQADCAACHNPHASVNFNLLKDPYPELFYAPFDPNNYRLCFNCHRSELVSSENGVGLTQFRNGSRNLHFVHVNKKDRGRTCRACHTVHASKEYAHIADSVPYGQWQFKLNFTLKPNGGSCEQGCHEIREYDRTKDLPPFDANRTGEN